MGGLQEHTKYLVLKDEYSFKDPIRMSAYARADDGGSQSLNHDGGSGSHLVLGWYQGQWVDEWWLSHKDLHGLATESSPRCKLHHQWVRHLLRF